MAIQFSARDKSILIGLFLSKFDDAAVAELGFNGIVEAFNTIGYAIGSKPSSLKNYTNEFDPYFPNKRQGWHKRPIRQYCKEFLDEFGQLPFTEFTNLVRSFIYQDGEIEVFIAKAEKRDFSAAVSKRLLTGLAAEEYFKTNYSSVHEFSGFSLTDTTKNACGFDFKLDIDNTFYCIEVKGLNALKGGISLTEKEHQVAANLRERYCLFVVSNFIEKPVHQYFFDPLHSNLSFSKTERQIIQRTYNTQV